MNILITGGNGFILRKNFSRSPEVRLEESVRGLYSLFQKTIFLFFSGKWQLNNFLKKQFLKNSF